MNTMIIYFDLFLIKYKQTLLDNKIVESSWKFYAWLITCQYGNFVMVIS